VVRRRDRSYEIGLFVRTPQLVIRARAAIEGLSGANDMVTAPMSLAKGLESPRGVLPLDERVVDAADEAELDEIYETERRLLYVACTRAREHLLLTEKKSVVPAPTVPNSPGF
jgi:superfamily I DNA/RNA helicase